MALLKSKPASRRVWFIASVAPLAAFIVAAKVMNTNPPTNSAHTAPDAPDAAFKTRVYTLSLEQARQKITETGGRISTYGRRWTLDNKASDNDNTLVFRVPVLVFTDILTVTLADAGEEQVRVNIESHSQIGKGDFGENRRHLRQILSALDSALPG